MPKLPGICFRSITSSQPRPRIGEALSHPPSTLRKLRISSDTFQVGSQRRQTATANSDGKQPVVGSLLCARTSPGSSPQTRPWLSSGTPRSHPPRAEAHTPVLCPRPLHAGVDSKGSMRPRLTLEPLSYTLHLQHANHHGRATTAGRISRLQRARRPHPHRLVARQDPRLAAGPGADPRQLYHPNNGLMWSSTG